MKFRKKALFFEGLIFFIILIILTTAFITLYKKQNKFEFKIGERQFSLIKTYQKAEKALFYIDQSTKYSLQQSIYELGKDGGLSEVYVSEVLIPKEEPYIPKDITKTCSKFYGYSLWYEKDNVCFDENKIKLNLELLFNQKLNNYLINYPTNIPLNNYNYEIKDSIEIIGKAKEPLMFDIIKDEKKEVVKEPIEEKIVTKEGIAGFKDFTGTELCAKGTTCELTEESYQKLEVAQKIAKEKGFSLEIYSAYRSEEEQKSLWEGETPERYKQRFPNEEERRRYVCNPYKGVEECPHLTGKAVDIRFKGKTNSQMTAADWKELEKIMYKAGFRRYTAELWHYECCGTARYNRAIALEKETGKEVRAVT